MKSISYLAALVGLFLAGCVVQPTAGPGNSTGNMCPPGQAKKAKGLRKQTCVHHMLTS